MKPQRKKHVFSFSLLAPRVHYSFCRKATTLPPFLFVHLAQKILPVRTKHIHQHTGLNAHNSVHGVGRHIIAIAGCNSFGNPINRHIKYPAFYIGYLAVRVMVCGSNGTCFKFNFQHHHFVIIPKQLTLQTIIQVFQSQFINELK